MRDLGVLPSELLRHILKSRNDQEKMICFEQSLALVRNWARILNQSESAKNSSTLKHSLYLDLLSHGVSLYQEVIINFCEEFITCKDTLLLLPQNMASACR